MSQTGHLIRLYEPYTNMVSDGKDSDDGDAGYLTVNSEDQTLTDADGESEHVEVTTTTTKAPNGGWGWCVVLGALIMRTVIGGFGRSHGLFYLWFKDRFGGSATETALVTSLTGFVRMATGPFVSVLSGRYSCRWITAIGSVVLMAGVLMTGYAPSLLFLYFSYGVVAGLGRSLAMTPCPILLGYYFEKRRSIAFGIASAGFSIGGFAITPLIELLFEEYGYSGAFLVLTAFTMNIFVAAALFRPIQTHIRTRKSSSQDEDSDETKRALIQTTIMTDEKRQCPDPVTIVATDSKVLEKAKNERTVLVTEVPSGNTSPIDNTGIVNSVNIHTLMGGNSEILEKCSFYPQIIPNDFGSSEVKTSVAQDEITSHKTNSATNAEDTHSKNTERTEDETNTNDVKDDKKKKKKWMSWSILKNPRFMCYVFAMFCFSLPASGTFLPALAKSKGCTELQAATILSISAACDTVLRVISGFVLDLRFFQDKRPLVYNIATFFQGSLLFLFPHMTSFAGFAFLSVLEGTFTGIKMAQDSVVLLDMLGVEKFATSLAVTMAAQCVSILVGPTISGRLIDTSGSYRGAFIFGGSSILLGGVVMAIGNIYNKITTRRAKSREKRDDEAES